MVTFSKNRFHSMARCYHKTVTTLLPHYDFLQNEALKIIDFKDSDKFTVVDLGAGSGLLAEKILKRYPFSKIFLIDYSKDFLSIADKYLNKFSGRYQTIECNIQDNWEQIIDKQPNFIISMSTIHHLTSDEKFTIYKKCFDVLSEGGWFINIDEMKTLGEQEYWNSLHFWCTFIETQYQEIEDKSNLTKYFKEWKPFFEDWKTRTFQNKKRTKKSGDDNHESFLKQVNLLGDIGFSQVDIFIKYHLWCIIGGKKLLKSVK